MTDELVEQFLLEGRELVQSTADDLTALAARPDDRARIDRAFRAVHTLKGSTGLFDLVPFGVMLHAAEDLLGALRQGTLIAHGPVIAALVACIDQAARWLDAFEQSGTLPGDAVEIGKRLQADLHAQLTGVAETPPAADSAWIDALLAQIPRRDGAALLAIRYTPDQGCFFRGDDPIAAIGGVPGLCALTLEPRAPWPPADAFDPFSCNLVIGALSTAGRAEVRAALRLAGDQVELVEVAASVEAAVDGTIRSLRVDVARVDRLADLADEIMVATNALSRLAVDARNGVAGPILAQGILASQAQLDRLGGGLHRAVMRLRLVPLSSLFRRFPRLARDIGARIGKEFDLVLRGETVEVDKSLVDGLFEPLLHLLRNAADHGIEPQEARHLANKPPRGTIAFGATQLGDQVILDVVDDGRGIDPAAIRRTALARGLVDAAVLADLPDDQVLDLVFRAGFSTAREVTDLSGRGVGLDAVRTAVAGLGGRVALISRLGAGTTIRLFLPVALAMTDVIIVACAGQRFGVPMDTVVETARIPPDRIMKIRHGRAFVLRDRAVPIVDLAALLGLETALSGRDLRALIIGSGDDLTAVAVDGFDDRLKLLLRPMSGLLAGMGGVAGTALLGDGTVLLVLDPRELLR